MLLELETGQKSKILLQHEDITDTRDAVSFCSSPDCGGISIFLGCTRGTEKVISTDNLSQEYQIEGLVYECYETMTWSEMKKISLQVLKDFPEVKRLYVCHRLGKVGVASPSVIIAASAAHRKDPQEVVSRVLNEVKKRAPIWKKVLVGDQTTQRPYWSTKSEAFWLK